MSSDITAYPSASTGKFYLPAIIILFIFFSAWPVCAQDNQTDKIPRTKFSRAERRWAVKWISSEISLYMGKGIVKKISNKEKKDIFNVFVGEKWYGLPFRTRGEFLKNLSRAREITEHSPFFSVYDDASQQLAAGVSRSAITIRLPDEGFFEYLYLPEKEKNTRY